MATKIGRKKPLREPTEITKGRWKVLSKSRDARFRRYALGNVFVEQLHTGMRWAEGPVWFGDGDYLIWSDIPNNRMMRWVRGHRRQRQRLPQPVQLLQRQHPRPRGPAGHLRAWRPAGHAAPSMTASITVLADSYEGKRLNSPNDVVVKSDGIDLVHRPALRHPDRL